MQYRILITLFTLFISIPKGRAQIETIHSLIHENDARKLEQYLEENESNNIDILDEWGRTPLFLAVSLGHMECAAILVEYGVDLKHLLGTGNTYLHLLAEQNADETLFNLFLSNNESRDLINTLNNKNQTPLTSAILFENNQVVIRKLLNSGADPRRGRIYGKNLFLYVIEREMTELLRDFIEAAHRTDGPNDDTDNFDDFLNAIDQNGDSPLSTGVTSKNLLSVAILLDAGARVDSGVHGRDEFADTRPYSNFFYAIQLDGLSMAALLLEHKGFPKVNVNEYRVHESLGVITSLDWAIAHSNIPLTVYLRANGGQTAEELGLKTEASGEERE